MRRYGPVFDPRSKLALVLSVIIVALASGVIGRVALLGGFFVVFVTLTGGISLAGWARSLVPIFILLPFLLVLNTVFYAGGEVWWSVPLGPVELSLTRGGFETALLIALRLLVIAGVAAWFAGTTGAEEFEEALVRLRVPWTFAFLLSLTLRLVPEMRRRFTVIEEAQLSRGLELGGNPITRARSRIPMLLPFFAAVIRFGYDLSEALTARGFDSIESRTSLVQIQHRPADYGLYVLAVLVLATPVVL